MPFTSTSLSPTTLLSIHHVMLLLCSKPLYPTYSSLTKTSPPGFWNLQEPPSLCNQYSMTCLATHYIHSQPWSNSPALCPAIDAAPMQPIQDPKLCESGKKCAAKYFEDESPQKPPNHSIQLPQPVTETMDIEVSTLPHVCLDGKIQAAYKQQVVSASKVKQIINYPAWNLKLGTTLASKKNLQPTLQLLFLCLLVWCIKMKVLSRWGKRNGLVISWFGCLQHYFMWWWKLHRVRGTLWQRSWLWVA